MTTLKKCLPTRLCSLPARLVFRALLPLCFGIPAWTQNIRPVNSGAIQSVSGASRVGVSQNVRAGAIARGPGGEKVNTAVSYSEASSRVVTGKVQGYGSRSGASFGGESIGTGGSSFNSSHDFPASDFVATMPKPQFGGTGAAAPPPQSSFGIHLQAVPTTASHAFGRARTGSTHVTHRDPAAILSPFTHPIGPQLDKPTGVQMPTGLGGH